MRLLNYINEGRSKSLTRRNVITVLSNNCVSSVKRFAKGNKIGRNTPSSGQFLHTKPGGDQRSSAHTLNYYTLIINNHPMGKDFPKREIICSGGSGDRAAQQFGGNLFNVFPFDGAKIGICPKDDIGESFKTLYKMGFSDANEFNELLVSLFPDLTDRDGKSFVKMSKSIDKEEMENSDMLQNIDSIEKFENLYEFLIKVYSPEGFKSQKIQSYSVGEREDVEVGTDRECVLVDYNETDEILGEVGDLLGF